MRTLPNPSDMSMFSQMRARSGRIMAQERNSAFRFSGSSVRPAYLVVVVVVGGAWV